MANGQGGYRANSGRKKKSFNEKATMKTRYKDMSGQEMPEPSAYLSTETKGASHNKGKDIFTKTWQWLVERECDSLIHPSQVERYAMTVARWMQAEDAMKVFGDRAGPGMMALLAQGSDALLDMEKAITGTNAAGDIANKQTDTLQGQMKLLTSQVEEIALQFGDVLIPIIRQLLNKYITPMIAKFAGLSSGTKKNIVTIALLAAAIGPLLLVIASIGMIVKVGSLLFSKVGLIIAIIAAVVLVIKRLWDTNEEFRNAVKKIWEKIKGFILSAVNAVKDWWDKNGEKLIKRVVSALKKVWNVVKTVFGKIKQIAAVVWPIVKVIVIDTVTAIKTFWEQNGAKIWVVVSNLFKTIWEIVKVAFDIIYNAVMKFLTYVRPIWENIKSLFASLWDTKP